MFTNFFLLTAVVTSQNINARQLLNNVIHEKFQVDFEYDYHEENEEKPRHGQGTLSLYKNQYRINFLDREIICNGRKMWNFDKNSNTVNITNEIEDEDNPLFLLINYKRFFEFKDYVKKNNSYLITMIPQENKEDDELDINYFEIVCDDKFIQQLNIFNDDGSWVSIRFKHWDLKINFAKNFFSFDKGTNDAKILELN